MSLITRMRKAKCVYWQSTGNDGFGGNTFADGVLIDCRWEDIQVLFVNIEGKEETSKTTVYVDRDMSVGDYLFNGTLAEAGGASINPQTLEDAREIKCFDKLPNLRYTEYLRTAFLK